MTTFENLNS